MTDRDLESTHLPVLLEEVLGFLQPERGGLFVDATLGLGGHAQSHLARLELGLRCLASIRTLKL